MNTGNGNIAGALEKGGFAVRLCSFSALDSYLGLPSLPFTFLETNAGITELARTVEDLYFPGTDIADGASNTGGRRWFFRCKDEGEPAPYPSYTLLSLVQNFNDGRFFDDLGIYPHIFSLKKALQKNEGLVLDWWEELHPRAGCFQALMDGALILARYEVMDYPPKGFAEALNRSGIKSPLGPEIHQALLLGLMASPRPDRGLEFLKTTGFLEKFWPEIARLDEADHAKEFHPEGNAWNHTLQTFSHRKHNAAGEYDLRLSLALLLHDIGKPLAPGSEGRRYNGHAEIGARAAARFLERLEFAPELVNDVSYLVKNHMLPAALARLPLLRTGDIMQSPLFPSLMELYRCDESSSFKGLEDYYENSAAYQAYLRNTKNPFRSPDGKKLAAQKNRSYPK